MERVIFWNNKGGTGKTTFIEKVTDKLNEYYVGEKDREQNESVILLGYANMSDEKILHAARLLDEAWNKEGN